MKNKKHPDSSGNKSSKAMSYSCLTNFFHKTLSHFFKKFVFINLMLLTIACKKEKPTEYDTLAFDMQVEDVSCTEVWLKVKLGENLQPRNITLKRENTTIFTGEILNSDTTFIDENLLPKRSYKYTISKLNELGKEISRDVVATTMDTTSHDFTWQIDTLGDGASSVLYDVAIINDTLAYAVGEIYKRDSLGNWDPEPYNLVKWDGKRWELKRVPFYYRGSTWYLPLRCITAFGPNDIWFEAGIHWNGKEYRTIPYTIDYPARINKGWGTSSRDFYVVGTNGLIAHYDGARWRRLESGTDVHLLDVWGSPDGKIVWTCGYYYDRIGTFLLRKIGNKWEMAYDGTISEFVIRSDSLSGAFTSVYTDRNRRIYVASSVGVYEAPWNTRGEAKRLSFTPTWFPGFPQRIRGTGANDWFIVGAFNFIAHYNGNTWRHYSELMHGDGRLLSVSQRGNLVVAVGYLYHPIHSRAIVFRGRR